MIPYHYSDIFATCDYLLLFCVLFCIISRKGWAERGVGKGQGREGKGKSDPLRYLICLKHWWCSAVLVCGVKWTRRWRVAVRSRWTFVVRWRAPWWTSSNDVTVSRRSASFHKNVAYTASSSRWRVFQFPVSVNFNVNSVHFNSIYLLNQKNLRMKRLFSSQWVRKQQ